MNDLGTWLPPLLVLAILAIPIFYKFTILPEYEQVIIHRLGRFHKLAGPGLVRYSRWLDTLERRIDVRDKKQSISLNGLFTYDIPFAFKLDIWMRYAPKEIAATDHEFLTRLAHIAENEQMSNVRTEVKRAVQQSLAKIQGRYPLPQNPGVIDRLLPIIPGAQICNEMLDLLKEHLSELLPQVGFVLSSNYDLTIFDISLGQDIIDIFNRGRLAKSLRDDIPTINDEMIFEFLGKVRGLDINVKHVIVDNPDGAEMRIRDEDRDVEIRPSRTRQRASAPPPIGPPPWERHANGNKDEQKDSAAASGVSKPASDGSSDSSNNQQKTESSQNPGIPIPVPVTDDDWRVMKAVPHSSDKS